MSRLSATLRLDARLQARNRVYLIVAVAAFGLAFALRALFTPEQLHFFMPLVALSGVSLTTFILVGVLLLLERAEGTLDVVLVSPLRPGEYLASKLLTVTALALVESFLIAGVAYAGGSHRTEVEMRLIAIRHCARPLAVIGLVGLLMVINSRAWSQDPDYVLSLSHASAVVGQEAIVATTLDSTGSPISGWSYGVCHDR